MFPQSTIDLFWTHVTKTDYCWEWNARRDDKGYGQMGYHPSRGRLQSWKSHRFSYTQANGAIPTGMHVLHTCDNPPCVRPDHLFLGTHFDNMRDMCRKGRLVTFRGSANGHSKLTEADALAIRRRHGDGEGIKALASDFGVSKATAYRIAKGLGWKHIS